MGNSNSNTTSSEDEQRPLLPQTVLDVYDANATVGHNFRNAVTDSNDDSFEGANLALDLDNDSDDSVASAAHQRSSDRGGRTDVGFDTDQGGQQDEGICLQNDNEVDDEVATEALSLEARKTELNKTETTRRMYEVALATAKAKITEASTIYAGSLTIVAPVSPLNQFLSLISGFAFAVFVIISRIVHVYMFNRILNFLQLVLAFIAVEQCRQEVLFRKEKSKLGEMVSLVASTDMEDLLELSVVERVEVCSAFLDERKGESLDDILREFERRFSRQESPSSSVVGDLKRRIMQGAGSKPSKIDRLAKNMAEEIIAIIDVKSDEIKDRLVHRKEDAAKTYSEIIKDEECPPKGEAPPVPVEWKIVRFFFVVLIISVPFMTLIRVSSQHKATTPK